MYDPTKGFAGQVNSLNYVGSNQQPQPKPSEPSMRRAASVLFEILAEENENSQKAQERLDLAAQQHMAEAHKGFDSDREALDAHLHHFTPESILQELLGDLFVHPNSLRYIKLLGEGAFATVHLASLLPSNAPKGSSGKSVAVKQLKPEVLKESNDLKDFLMEVNVMRKLTHTNIVAILGIGASDLSSLDGMRGSMFVLMEAMSGGNLKLLVIRQMMAAKPLYTCSDALRWLIQIASAMHYLHKVCRPMIIHRDLKLENLLLTDGPMSERVAKLADFGLHKRARLNAKTGLLTTPAGFNRVSTVDYEKSYYGGGFFYNNPSIHRGAANNPSAHPKSNPIVHHTASRGSEAAPLGAPLAPSPPSPPPPALPAQRLAPKDPSPLVTSPLTTPRRNSQLEALPSEVYDHLRPGTSKPSHGEYLNPVNFERPTPNLPNTLNQSVHNAHYAASQPSSNNPTIHATNSNNPSTHNPSLHSQPPGSNPSTHGGMHKVASLRSMVAAATALPPGQQALAARSRDQSTHGGRLSCSPNPSTDGGAHGSNAAFAALAAVGHKSETSQAPSANDEKPMSLIALATDPDPYYNLQVSSIEADELKRMSEPPAMKEPLPPGWNKLLHDPAQRVNLESLHSFLDDKPVQHEQQAEVQAAENESVHRKMLALMALDRPQKPSRLHAGNTSSLQLGNSQQLAGSAYTRPSMTMEAAGGAMKPIPEDNVRQPSMDLPSEERPLLAPEKADKKGPSMTQLPAIGEATPRETPRDTPRTPGQNKSVKGGMAGLKGMHVNAQFADATQQVGSLMYMSPELVRGHQYNEKVDVFSFGIIMYELFVGRMVALRPEFMSGGEEAVEQYVKARSNGAREKIPDHWPPELQMLVSSCWAQDPSQRPDFGAVYGMLKDMQASGVFAQLDETVKAATSGGCCAIS